LFKIILLFLLLLTTSGIFSQEAVGSAGTEKDSTPAESEKSEVKSASEKKEKTIRELREEKILFGINSEILQLLKNLKEEKNSDFNDPLKNILAETKNQKVIESILELYINTEYFDADNVVYLFVKEKEYSGKNVVRNSIKYLSATGKDKYNPDFSELLESNDESYRIEAVKALSKSGSTEYTQDLIDLYEIEESEKVKIEILLNIGELKDSSSSDFLIEILEDDYADKTSKQYACNSLGLIGDDKAFPYLVKTYEDPDPYIRAYALSAISKYSKDETEKLLLQALKDDSWQIRKQAAVSSAELKKSSFVPYLKYKAEHDPAKPVRTESVKALAAIASSESLKFLREKASDKKTSLILRKQALVELIKNDLSGSLSVIDKILEDEWESITPVLLETACSTLAAAKSDKLKTYYEKMLDHPSLTIKFAGMKGIKLNKVSSLKKKIEKFTGDGVSSSVKNYAKSVLEEL
jgi:HEAT repeat protein